MDCSILQVRQNHFKKFLPPRREARREALLISPNPACVASCASHLIFHLRKTNSTETVKTCRANFHLPNGTPAASRHSLTILDAVATSRCTLPPHVRWCTAVGSRLLA